MNQPAHVPSPYTAFSTAPEKQGLYDPGRDRDACGVAFVATLRGTPGRDIVDAALTALANLDHRGAVGAEASSGDGAGILLQVPDAFFREVLQVDLPDPGRYAVGTFFLPADPAAADRAAGRIGAIAAEEGLQALTWREAPTEDRKSTRLNSSHVAISYVVFCLKRKKNRGCRRPRRQYRPPQPQARRP